MSTALLALALLIGLGVVTFLITLGLTSLGLLLSWIFPLTLFQSTLLQLILFSLALIFLGVTFLFERLKDLFRNASDEADEEREVGDGRTPVIGGHATTLGRPTPLPHRRAYAQVGRNDPCPCGSGRRYKFCCLMKP
jgi:SEC-C motif